MFATTSFLFTSLLLPFVVLSAPISNEAQCVCELSSPGITDANSLQQCQRLATRLEAQRDLTQITPYLFDLWAPERAPQLSGTARVTSTPRARSLRSDRLRDYKAAIESIAGLPTPVQSPTQTSKPIAALGQYSIICHTAIWSLTEFPYVSFEQIPVLFVILSLALCFVTILDWAIAEWQER